MSDEAPNYSAVPNSAVPIREVSRLTGVNTVTLRAWERRHGLLKPLRTIKGHRLYSSADIKKVRDIQEWLARGLAIGKVKDILVADAKQPLGIAVDNPWPEHINQMDMALAQLNRSSLERLFRELITLYPIEILADRLLSPLVDRLQWQRQFGSVAKLAFLQNIIREHFLAGQYRTNGRATSGRLLIVKLNSEDNDILPLMLNYSLLVATHQSEYLGYVPKAELIFAAEQMCADAIVLYGDSVSATSGLRERLEDWRKAFPVPLFLVGKIVAVCAAHASSEQKYFVCAETQQTAVAAIRKMLLG